MEALPSEEVERYHRQMLLNEVSVDGQKKLRSSKVLVIGAGGLGSPILLYLAGAGIGTLGIIDGDCVETINLHRQIIHTSTSLKVNKAESAKKAILSLNPLVKVHTYHEWLSTKNSSKIIPDYDILVIATDNVESRYLISDLGVFYNKPVISGSCVRWDGQLTVFYQGPCLRCIFPVPTPRHALIKAADVGVLGPVPGVIGTLQAVEVIKIVLGLPSLTGKMLLYDGLACRFRLFQTRGKSETCPACTKTIDPHTFDYTAFVGTLPPVVINENLAISAQELGQIIRENNELGENWQKVEIVDVRNPNHYLISTLPGAKNILQHELDKYLPPPNEIPIVVIDRNGAEACKAVEKLISNGVKCRFLLGGLDSWKADNPTFTLF